MAESNHDIDFILRGWPFKPGVIAARLVRAGDGREVLQMRVEMGLLQMEVTGRPDGEHPGGADTASNGSGSWPASKGEAFALERAAMHGDRPRVLAVLSPADLLPGAAAVRPRGGRRRVHAGTDGLCGRHIRPTPQWTLSHEQYRPFVLFHRIQAAAMLALQQSGAEAAIETINRGLGEMRQVFVKFGAEEQFDQDGLVSQLAAMKESLREEYRVGKTLAEQLADAVAAEEYERAARLRDQIAQRRNGITPKPPGPTGLPPSQAT